MAFSYRLEDYVRYRDQVGKATYVDITRRADPARFPRFWDHLREIASACGAPWVIQVWSKDVAGVLALGGGTLAAMIEAGTTVTAQITITGLASTIWEPLVPVDALQHLPRLARLIGGPKHIVWRYDPIIPTVHDLDRYRQLAYQIGDLGIERGIINFVAPPGRYTRVDRRIRSVLPSWVEGMEGYDVDWQTRVATDLVRVARDAGIALACCAEGAALHQRVAGLGRAACGDYRWFVQLSGQSPPEVPFRGSRRGCGCARYYDVGSYGHWTRCFRCVYCYAG